MSQNARVALWVPTDDPPHSSNDAVTTTGLPDSISKIPTRFSLAGSGGGGGGIEEAPVDGEFYSRRNAGWEVAPSGGGGLPDAPNDGKPYLRQSASWQPFDIIDGGTF